MKIQRARLLLLLMSLVTSGGLAYGQTPPPGALNPALGPSQLPPGSPYYNMPSPSPYGGSMGPGMPTGAMAMSPGRYAIPGPGVMPPGAMPPNMMPPGAMMGPMPAGMMAPGGGMPGGISPAAYEAMQMGAQAGAMAVPGGSPYPYGVMPVGYDGCQNCGPLPGQSGAELACGNCGGQGCNACGGTGRGHGVDRGLDALSRVLKIFKPYGEGGWCAPRWYDAHAEFIYMTRDEGNRGGGLVSDGPAGLGAPLIVLSSDSADLDSAGGFKAGFALHAGASGAVEFSYFGALNWAGAARVESPLDELYHVFSDFGNNPPPQAVPIIRGGFTDTDSAQLATLEYSSNFDTLELDYRRRWVAPNCRFHGSWLIGARYAKLDEQLVHTMVVDYPDPNGGGAPDITGFLDAHVGTSNSMTGAQLGGDLWITLLPGFRVGSEFKGGIYGNRASQRTVINAGQLAVPVIEEANSDVVSFLLELNIQSVWRLNENWSIRKGYTLMFVDGLALAPENFNTNEPFTAARVPLLVDDGSIFMHGFTVGLEWMW